MMCSCIEEMDALLGARNGRLQVTINMKDGTSLPLIGVEKIASRGSKPPLAIPSYCPFCGENLITAKPDESLRDTRRVKPSEILIRLTGAQRRHLCLAAITQALGREGERNMLAPLNGFSAAEMHGSQAIRDVLDEAVPDLFEEGRAPLPDLSDIGIASCPQCGCTDDLACSEICGWSDQELDGQKLCTSCAPPGFAPDSAPGSVPGHASAGLLPDQETGRT